MSAGSRTRYRVQIGDRSFVVSLESANGDGARRAWIDDREVQVSAAATHPRGATALMVDGESVDAFARSDGDTWAVSVDGRPYDAEVTDDALARFRRAGAQAAQNGREVLRAPMPGLVVGLSATVGERVEGGGPVVVLEAMKMQNELTAKAGGTVREIRVAPGDKVEKGAILAVIES